MVYREVPMPHLNDTLLESEEFLSEYSNKYPAVASAYEELSQRVNLALKISNIESIFPLISYMESEDGYPLFQFISEARYLYRILSILTLEHRYKLHSFAYNIDSKNKLIKKYKLSLFSVRRILFDLSAESVSEAEVFLINNSISPIAIYIIAKEELIIPSHVLFRKIEELFQSHWSIIETQLFHQLITTFAEDS